MKERKLIDAKELVRRHPALGAKPHRLPWLIRTRQIPFVQVGRRIYFDETEISNWIEHRSYAPSRICG
jgi:hypothetical protein